MIGRPPVFDEVFRRQFEDLIVWRRDVRRFKTDPVDPAIVQKLIELAALSPSVGNAQPWRFVLVTDIHRRIAVRQNFIACNSEALHDYEGERAALYARLKLSGLDQAPVQLAVFCDRNTTSGFGLGQKTMPETLDYSVVAAVQALWLAARAWGVGVGWVSIIDPERVRETLDVPEHWGLVAYLCIGYPEEEHAEPELVRYGWQDREGLEKLVLRR